METQTRPPAPSSLGTPPGKARPHCAVHILPRVLRRACCSGHSRQGPFRTEAPIPMGWALLPAEGPELSPALGMTLV